MYLDRTKCIGQDDCGIHDGVSAYVDINGNTFNCNYNINEKKRNEIIAAVMLHDIQMVKDGKADIEGIACINTYADMFNVLLGQSGNPDAIIKMYRFNDGFLCPCMPSGPYDMEAGLSRLYEAQESLWLACKRMEEDDIYPLSVCFQKMIKAKYYTDIWLRQIEALLASRQTPLSVKEEKLYH